ncbi:DUF6879 family protein [Kitasatospora sp. P5_F3]
MSTPSPKAGPAGCRWCGAPSLGGRDAPRPYRFRAGHRIALPGNEFWLLDGRIVRFNHFTGDGASGGQREAGVAARSR